MSCSRSASTRDGAARQSSSPGARAGQRVLDCATGTGDLALDMVGNEPHRALVADVLSDLRFPQQIWDELEALRRDDPARYQHAIWTALVSARLFRTALGM